MRDPRGVARHQDHRLLAVSGRRRVGLAHEDEEPAARTAGARGPPLAPVEDVGVAVAEDGTLDVGGIARGHARLGHGEGGADGPGQQRLEPLLLLRRRAVALEGLHVAGVGRGAVEHLRRPAHAPHHLAQRRVVEVGQAGPVVRVGQEQVPQPGGARLRLQFLQQRRLFPVLALLQLRVEALLVRVDVLVHERAQALKVFRLLALNSKSTCRHSSWDGRPQAP